MQYVGIGFSDVTVNSGSELVVLAAVEDLVSAGIVGNFRLGDGGGVPPTDFVSRMFAVAFESPMSGSDALPFFFGGIAHVYRSPANRIRSSSEGGNVKIWYMMIVHNR